MSNHHWTASTTSNSSLDQTVWFLKKKIAKQHKFKVFQVFQYCEIWLKLWNSEFRIRVYILISNFNQVLETLLRKRFYPFAFLLLPPAADVMSPKSPRYGNVGHRWKIQEMEENTFLINKCFCLCSMCKNSVHMLTPEVENNSISAIVNCVPAIDQCRWFMYR